MTEMARALRILVARPDRIGDVILSTPVFEALRRKFPECHIAAIVRPEAAPLLRGLSSVDEVIAYDPKGAHSGVSGFFSFIRQIKSGGFGIAVVLQSQWRLALAIFFAGVPFRVGPWSRIYSFFLYNQGKRQRRSQVRMHEADYNLRLLGRLGIWVEPRSIPVTVKLSDAVRARALDWMREQGWGEGDSWIAIHPGMGGSALNWPEDHYVELIWALLREDRKVLITGGPADADLVSRLKQRLGSDSGKVRFFVNQLGGSIEDLAGIFSYASAVVAPSTGPLHLAVALGKPVVTFYPPIRVQSSARWGPYSQHEKMASVLVPDVHCGEDRHCRGSLCHDYPCMNSITVDRVMEAARLQLSGSDLKRERHERIEKPFSPSSQSVE